MDSFSPVHHVRFSYLVGNPPADKLMPASRSTSTIPVFSNIKKGGGMEYAQLHRFGSAGVSFQTIFWCRPKPNIIRDNKKGYKYFLTQSRRKPCCNFLVQTKKNIVNACSLQSFLKLHFVSLHSWTILLLRGRCSTPTPPHPTRLARSNLATLFPSSPRLADFWFFSFLGSHEKATYWSEKWLVVYARTMIHQSFIRRRADIVFSSFTRLLLAALTSITVGIPHVLFQI